MNTKKNDTKTLDAFIHDFMENGKTILPEDIDLKSLFLHACTTKHLSFVQFLSETGFDIHVNDDEGLHYACYYGHIPIVDYLLENNCSLTTRSNRGIRWAIENNQFAILKHLIHNHQFNPNTILTEAQIHEYETTKLDNFIDWCQSYIDSQKLKTHLDSQLTTKDDKIKIKQKI